MNAFILKYQDKIKAVLQGWDRLIIKGTLRYLQFSKGIQVFLDRHGVLLKNFGDYAHETTEKLIEASLKKALQQGRPNLYLPSSQIDKKKTAQKIMEKDHIHQGLICVLRALEPCRAIDIKKDHPTHQLIPILRSRKCLHLYHYWMDPQWGLASARIQTWFPFDIQICLNGREWLAQQMDQHSLSYEKRDNCFIWLSDPLQTQRLFDQILKQPWTTILNQIAQKLNPIHDSICPWFPLHYYWTVPQSEWATDLLFSSPKALNQIYPALIQGAITSFASPDVLRFFGKKLDPSFQGKVETSWKERPEGIRVKHSFQANSLKFYNKQGNDFRVETTLNSPSVFKVYRSPQGDPGSPKKNLPLRKSIADLKRRAEVSQAANDRYLNALASLDTSSPLFHWITPLCSKTEYHGKSVRALHPFDPQDALLLQTVNRGEFKLQGFRNRDLLPFLFPDLNLKALSQDHKRKFSAKITRKLRLLRAHHLIQKISHTHRYSLTKNGQQIITALLQISSLSLEKLNLCSA